jgi:hypothetical protein
MLGQSLAAAVASIPIIVALRDTTFRHGLGIPMTPTPQYSDVVLVRRREMPWLLGIMIGQSKDDEQRLVDPHDWMQGIMTANRLSTVPGEIVVVRNPLLLNNNNHVGTKSNDRFVLGPQRVYCQTTRS